MAQAVLRKRSSDQQGVRTTPFHLLTLCKLRPDTACCANEHLKKQFVILFRLLLGPVCNHSGYSACCCCTAHVLNLLRQNFLCHGSIATCVQTAAFEDNLSQGAVNADRRALAWSFTASDPKSTQIIPACAQKPLRH